jgi:cellulose synthase/poly-beta-1,6-N-acetylglucosamine synthase-like glycosyltransferase
LFFYLYIKYWRALPFFEITEGYVPKTFISILIPARNEEDTVLKCIDSILKNTYPKNLYEIIVIDDHSEDNTPQLVTEKSRESINVRLIQLIKYIKLAENQPYKKRAIEAAIGEAQGNLIVTTDADCIVSENWLMMIAAFYETQGKRFIAAPVCFHEEQSAFERFQSLDYIGMMGITGAGVQGRFTHMCNGANLAYDKKLFYEVGGFKGIDHISSGDDMLLMQKVARRFPKELGFLKNIKATVFTKAKPTIKDFIHQRTRWASKSSSYIEFFTVFQLATVYIFCCNIVLSLLLSTLYDLKFFIIFILSALVKIIADYTFLKIITRFFKREDLMSPFITPQLLHVIYIIFVGLLANVKKTYVWKGRKTR